MDYQAYSKAFYASQILRLVVLTLTKVSYMFVFMRLISTSSEKLRHMRSIFLFLLALFLVWGVGSAFAYIFQCRLPSPWEFQNNTCVDQAALYYVTGVFNIASDFIIILMPAIIVFNVRLKRNERMVIIGIFGTRIAAILAAAVELGYLPQYLWWNDPTWLNENPTIWGQAMLNLSLITACFPLMKPMLDMLQFSLVDTSTLPFSVDAGRYNEHYKGQSPMWSREKGSSPHHSNGKPHNRGDPTHRSPFHTGTKEDHKGQPRHEGPLYGADASGTTGEEASYKGSTLRGSNRGSPHGSQNASQHTTPQHSQSSHPPRHQGGMREPGAWPLGGRS